MCILVVEDDPLIRAILVEELTDAGHDVREAESGDRALSMLDALDPPIWLLVTDVHMPGALDGLALAALVRTRRPDIPVIYTTGRPDALRTLGTLARGQYLVRKPYVPAEILERVEALRP